MKAKSILVTAIIFISACTRNIKSDRSGQLAGMYKLSIIENQDSLGVWHEEQWARE